MLYRTFRSTLTPSSYEIENAPRLQVHSAVDCSTEDSEAVEFLLSISCLSERLLRRRWDSNQIYSFHADKICMSSYVQLNFIFIPIFVVQAQEPRIQVELLIVLPSAQPYPTRFLLLVGAAHQGWYPQSGIIWSRGLDSLSSPAKCSHPLS